MGPHLDQSVSPGIVGFIVIFLLALALWMLMRNMIPRLRNVRYRQEAEAQSRQQAHDDPASTP